MSKFKGMLGIIVIFFIVMCVNGSADAAPYISDQVQGEVTTIPNGLVQDHSDYILNVNQVGTTIILLKWTGDALLELEIDDPGNSCVIQKYKNQQIATLNITDLTEMESIDFPISVKSYSGTAEYVLSVIKPDQLIPNINTSYVNQVALFTYSASGAQNDLVILGKGKGALSGVTLRILDKKTKNQIFEKYFSQNIVMPQLAPGDYDLIISKKGTYGIENVLVTTGTPVDIGNEFYNSSIQTGETKRLEIQKNGQKYFWLLWNKVVEEQEIVSLQCDILDQQGNIVSQGKIIDPNGIVILPVENLADGDYTLEISSLCTAYFALAGETSTEFVPMTITDFEFEKTLLSGEELTYEISLPGSTTQGNTVMSANDITCIVEIKNPFSTVLKGKIFITTLAGVLVAAKDIELQPNQQGTFPITFPNTALVYRVTLLVLEGEARVITQSKPKDPETPLPPTQKVPATSIQTKVANGDFLISPQNLVYFMGTYTHSNWKDIDFETEVGTKTITKDGKKKDISVIVPKGIFTSTKKQIPVSYYYDLETVQLKVKQSIIDGAGKEDPKAKPVYIDLDSWWFEPLPNVSKVENVGTDKQLLVDIRSNGHTTNKILLYKDEFGQFRLRVEWLADSTEAGTQGLLVGTIKGKKGKNVTESPIRIHAINLAAYNHEAWDTVAYNEMKKIKETGVETNGKNPGPVSFPFQMIRGQIMQESSYSKVYRYEPFWDMAKFYFELEVNKDVIRQIKTWGQANLYVTPKLNADLTDDLTGTIYGYYWDHKNMYWPKDKLWPKTPRNTWDLIKDPNKREPYLQAYLNYGTYVAQYWFEQKGLHDAFNPATFEKTWQMIRTKTYNGKYLVINSKALKDDYSLDKKIWQDAREGNKLLKSVDIIIGKYYNKAASQVPAENMEKMEGEIKKLLSLYIKYEHCRVWEWFNNGQIKTAYDPSNSSYSRPFTAQTKIAASYGPIQVLYINAWVDGIAFQKDPEAENLADYRGSMGLGLKYMYHQYTSNRSGYHFDDWNIALKSYNGGWYYPGKIRDREKEYLSKMF